MRIVRITLILSVFFLFAQRSDVNAAKGLKLSVSFDKSEYKQSDPIYITFKLENKAKKPLYVNKRFYVNSEEARRENREIYLSVISPSGEKLPCKVSYETGLPKTDYFVLLKPGEEVSTQRKQNIKHYFDFKDRGTYKITATYQNIYGEEIEIDTFKHRIVSEPVIIEIVE